MRYRVTRHPSVRSDLLDIARMIGDYAGYDTVRPKMSAFRKTMQGLQDFPHIGTVRDDLLPGLRAIPSAEKGVICFTVDDTARTVFIICVTYAGADWEGRVKARG